MMPIEAPSTESIFWRGARASSPRAERPSLPRPGLRRRRRAAPAGRGACCAAHRRPGQLPRAVRGRPAARASSTPPTTRGPRHASIGPYKLLEQIGEGGMGAVYMAEQSEPVRRRVALKIIKPGMDTPPGDRPLRGRAAGAGADGSPEHRQGARRRRDRRGPALLRHGAGQGRPDHRVLRPSTSSRTGERLELFVPVCQAVQHAHQKGIIHRDLKPSNVLVALYDGKPVPKVIDFGVAKATGQTADRDDAVHRLRRSRRHAGVHEPRAGGARRPRRRHAQRHLLAGRAALRAADRHDAARPQAAEAGGAAGGAAASSARRSRRKPSTRLSTTEERCRRSRPTATSEPAQAVAAWCAASWTGS